MRPDTTLLACRDMQQLFTQLVQGGVLIEADFWRGRQAHLQQRLQSGKGPSQRVGLSSVMLAHMQGSQDGRSNTVRITFSVSGRQRRVVLEKGTAIDTKLRCAGDDEADSGAGAADICRAAPHPPCACGAGA